MVLRESTALVSSEVLLRTPVKVLPPDVQCTVWSVLDVIDKKVIDARKKELREALLEYAEEHGTVDKQSLKVKFPDGAVVARQRQAGRVEIDPDKVFKLSKKVPQLKNALVRVVEFSESQLSEMRQLIRALGTVPRIPKSIQDLVARMAGTLDEFNSTKLQVNPEVFEGLIAGQILDASQVKDVTEVKPDIIKLKVTKSKAVKELEKKAVSQ